MRRIVHIIDNLKLGGAETLLLSTVKRLPEYEHHIITLTPGIEIKGFEDKAQIYCLHHYGWLSTYKSCRKLKKIVAVINPAVVHAHLFLSSFLARLALDTQYNIIYSLHNLFSETVFKHFHTCRLEKMIYHPKHRLIAVSHFVLQDYKKVVTKCHSGYVLYNFIDDVFIKNPEVKKTIPPSSIKNWVAVGSLKRQKNYDLILALFKSFYENASDKENIRLDIYGDGPLRKELEEHIQKLGLPIFLKGNHKHLAQVLQEYDGYISASLYEGYGIAPMEALAIGLPVFLSNIPVYKEIYHDYGFFFEVNESSTSSFLEQCKAYSALPLVQRQELMHRSQAFAASVADGEAYIKQLLEIYQLRP